MFQCTTALKHIFNMSIISGNVEQMFVFLQSTRTFLTLLLQLHTLSVLMARRSLHAWPYAVTSVVTKETPRRGKEVPKGIRHGEERHVVHSLSLEKSLSEIHRLIRPISCIPRQLQEDGSRGGVTAKRAALRGFLRPARSSLIFQIQRLFKSGECKKRKEETSASPATFF